VRRPQIAAIYARKRLFRTLDAAHKQHRIVWLAGPPGAGKTTLASSYIEARGLPCLWYQIDESDNDVASFFHYFDQAVQAAAPPHGEPLPHLTPEHLPTLGVFVRRYFQAVFDRFPLDSVWVFDNYHALPAESPLHEVLRVALTELPPTVRVIAVSRNDPPPALARLSVHNQLTIVDTQTLKLTPEEATGIAQQLGHGRAAHEMIQRIHAQTDGWAAGLVLLLGREQTEPGATGLTAPQALFDYFAGEIFHKMDAATQRILLESALLPTMTPGTVEQLTGETKSAAVLADLARRSYFTVKSTHAEISYQYHALFRAFLLRELKTRYPPASLAELHLKAAAQLEAEGRIEEAVEVLHAAGAWPELVRVIVMAAPLLAAQARLETIAQWIAWLPVEMTENNGWLLFWLAQRHLMINPAASREYSEKAFALFDQADDALGLYLSLSSVMNALSINWQSLTGIDRWADIFDTLQRRHPVIPSPEADVMVTFSMLAALVQRLPSRPDLPMWLERAKALMHGLPDVNQRILIGSYLANHYMWVGDMKATAWVIQTLEPMYTDKDVAPMSGISWHVVSALYYWGIAGKPGNALDLVNQAWNISEASGARAMDFHITMHGVFASLVMNDVQHALIHLTRMQGMLNRPNPNLALYYYCSSLVATHENDLTLALSHAYQAVMEATRQGALLPMAVSNICLAWVLSKFDKPGEAKKYLEQAQLIGQTMKSSMIECLCLTTESMTALDRGEHFLALEPLSRALALDREMGGVSSPNWSSRELVPLYTFALEHSIEVEHVRATIRKRNLVPETPPLDVEQWPWPYRFYTLGRFSIIQDDAPLTLTAKGQKKPLELLKALIACGGREVSQAQLTAALWPDAEGDAGQQAFEVTLHRLRKMLGEDAPLQLKDGRLTLDARRCWVDVWAFERLLSTLEAGLREHKPDGLDALTQKLFTLYQGAVLDRESELPATLSLRERLRSRFLRNLKELGRHHESQQAWDRATEYYLRALEVEPLAEEFYQKLMLGYHTLERTAEGLAVYERCKKTLHTSLGVGPSRETEALRQSLVAGRA